MLDAQAALRANHSANHIQKSRLLNIKSGGCAENCGYCRQSAHFKSGLKAGKLMATCDVLAAAQRAKDEGAERFCMGAAWRELKDRDVPRIAAIVGDVKALGLETCMTLGMVTPGQATALKDAGLNYYNHNVDTSEAFYASIVTTRRYQDRLDTLAAVREAGIKVCCGGIIGMGEAVEDRADMLATLARLDPQPESVPINLLVPIPGTPLGEVEPLSPLELVRTIAVARIMMPQSMLRLSAGRRSLSDEAQALCFHAGANSIFYGDRLLTTGNPDHEKDLALFGRLGLQADM